MKQIEAYQTSDGQIFDDEDKAESHQTDIIGELLDGLILDDPKGQFSRIVRRRILLAILDDPNLKSKIADLNKHLQH